MVEHYAVTQASAVASILPANKYVFAVKTKLKPEKKLYSTSALKGLNKQ